VNDSSEKRIPGRRQQGGPPLIAVGLAYGVLTLTGVILSIKTPQPSAGAAAVLAYDRSHQTVMQVAGFFQFAAAALALIAAVVTLLGSSLSQGDDGSNPNGLDPSTPCVPQAKPGPEYGKPAGAKS